MGLWIFTEENFFYIIFVLIFCFSIAGLLVSGCNFLSYERDFQMIKTKYEAYSEVINDPTLSLLFEEEIDNFNTKIKEAKMCNSLLLRWAFVSPAYATFNEIERSE